MLEAPYTQDFIREISEKYNFRPNETQFDLYLGAAISDYRDIVDRDSSLINRSGNYKNVLKATTKIAEAFELLTESHYGNSVMPAAWFLNEYNVKETIIRRIEEGRLRREELIYEKYLIEKSLCIAHNRLIKNLEKIKPVRGRPENLGISAFVQTIAHFWIDELKRPFTVDYHKGAGLTEAFCFIQDLLSPITDNVDTQIVSAMRKFRANLHPHKKEPK